MKMEYIFFKNILKENRYFNPVLDCFWDSSFDSLKNIVARYGSNQGYEAKGTKRESR